MMIAVVCKSHLMKHNAVVMILMLDLVKWVNMDTKVMVAVSVKALLYVVPCGLLLIHQSIRMLRVANTPYASTLCLLLLLLIHLIHQVLICLPLLLLYHPTFSSLHSQIIMLLGMMVLGFYVSLIFTKLMNILLFHKLLRLILLSFLQSHLLKLCKLLKLLLLQINQIHGTLSNFPLLISRPCKSEPSLLGLNKYISYSPLVIIMNFFFYLIFLAS
mmetsp:Transcript_18206/g.23713  ORF Transcript_18206/g.23713 Transcript_18206/m.23713 type:complete len:216 (+) Transcript_18206:893-1540(+)